MWDAFKVKVSGLSTSPSIHSSAVQEKSQTTSSSTPALGFLSILQLQSHPSSSTSILTWKMQLDKEIHVRLRRTKSMVKAHHHTPGISVIPLSKSSPGEPWVPCHCALCASVPTFQPRMCCKRSCLLSSQAHHPGTSAGVPRCGLGQGCVGVAMVMSNSLERLSWL